MEARHANEPARVDRIGTAGSPRGVGERQRERIIRAATVVFSRKGYDGARVEAIAQKAGMPKGNVLYYFKSKKALYRIVIKQVLSLWLITHAPFLLYLYCLFFRLLIELSVSLNPLKGRRSQAAGRGKTARYL